MATKIRVVLPGLEKDKPSWPHVNYDVEARATDVVKQLQRLLPDIEFSAAVYYTAEEAERGYREHEEGKFDGWVLYLACLGGKGMGDFYLNNVRPLVVADELYSGSGSFLRFCSKIQAENLPVATVASSNVTDLARTVQLLDVTRQLAHTRILVFSNDDPPVFASPEEIDAARRIFGTEVILKSGADLERAYAAVPEKKATPLRDQWIAEAKGVVEPNSEEILRSARMHQALKNLMAEYDAQAVSVDCLSLFYSGETSAYPCISFFELNNRGETGVCEGDIRSTIGQLMFRYLDDKPAYVSDPVIDEATGQIIYAHCVATNRPCGPQGPANPYVIRSHAEDRKGASIQSLLPLGKTVTTIAVSPKNAALALHTAETVANLEEERACRTKLAAKADVEKIQQNYHFELFGLHQVTCYGNYRWEMKQLARLLGLTLYEQDR